jgi:uncharacterized protein YaiL (DUF2058 family)
MTSELAAQEAAVQKSVVGASGEEAEHQRCMKINQQWNEQVAKEREARLAKEREVKMEQILTELQQEETEKTQRMAEIKQLIAAEKVCYSSVFQGQEGKSNSMLLKLEIYLSILKSGPAESKKYRFRAATEPFWLCLPLTLTCRSRI